MLCIKFMQLHLLRNTANNITYGWLLKSTTAKKYNNGTTNNNVNNFTINAIADYD